MLVIGSPQKQLTPTGIHVCSSFVVSADRFGPSPVDRSPCRIHVALRSHDWCSLHPLYPRRIIEASTTSYSRSLICGSVHALLTSNSSHSCSHTEEDRVEHSTVPQNHVKAAYAPSDNHILIPCGEKLNEHLQNVPWDTQWDNLLCPFPPSPPVPRKLQKCPMGHSRGTMPTFPLFCYIRDVSVGGPSCRR